MKGNERKCQKMKENQRKSKKMKENEKMKKMKKKNEKNEKMKKNEEKWWKKKEKWKNWIQTQNPLRFPRFTVDVVTFFVEILRGFHDFVSECVSFQRKNQQPVLGGQRFSEDKWQFSLDVKQKHTFYRRKSTKKKS